MWISDGFNPDISFVSFGNNFRCKSANPSMLSKSYIGLVVWERYGPNNVRYIAKKSNPNTSSYVLAMMYLTC